MFPTGAKGKKLSALLLVGLFFAAGAFSVIAGEGFVSAQPLVPPVLAWQQTLPEESGVSANQIIQTSDGGYAVVCEGNYKNFSPGALVKLDAAGQVQWSKTYGVVNLLTLMQTTDDGFALVGYEFRGTSRPVLLRTDSNGNELWNQSYTELTVNSMLPAPDGGFIFAGSASTTHDAALSDSDFALAKVTSSGTLQWNKTYGDAGDDYAVSVVQTLDGGYALAGTTTSFDPEGESNMWLVKTDSEGNMQWDKAFGGLGDSAAYSVIQTNDGGYVLAGDTNAFGLGRYDAWLIKTDTTGNLLWTQTYGGTGELPSIGDLPTNFVAGSNGEAEDHAYCVIQTRDGGLAFVGASSYMPSGSATTLVWLVKTDSAGNPQWNQTFGAPFKTWAGNALIETCNGAFAIAGFRQEPGFPWIGNGYVVETEPSSPLPSLTPTVSVSPSSPPPTLSFPSTIILADGNIDPSTSPIQRIGNLYTLTDNLNGELVLNKDNVILDGAGYMLQGNGTLGGLIIRKSQTGVNLTDQTNITVRNLQITGYNYGIYLQNSTNITLTENRISQNSNGIFEKNSTFTTISKSNLTQNDYGVFITQSFNNNLSRNNIDDSLSFGITLNQSVGNVLFGNNLTTSSVDFESGSNNLVAGNLFYSSYFGIYLNGETNSTVVANNFTACSFAIDSPSGAFGNLFYLNSFNNTHINEFSGKEHNFWDNGTVGNFWSDYFTRYPNATEADNSGVGDIPYAMVYGLTDEYPYDGDVPNPNNVDRYPLLTPVSSTTAMTLAEELVLAHTWSSTPTLPPYATPSPSTSPQPDSVSADLWLVLAFLGLIGVVAVAALAFKLRKKHT
ncbi:MAG: nitrous oxide reductase family maturation protein NosD [Candidatus Bathyarchaeia archaeon]|jgi:parallel beta-helix repeat protein